MFFFCSLVLRPLRATLFPYTTLFRSSAEGLRLTLQRVWTRIQKLSAHAGKTKLVLRPKQEQLHQLRFTCRSEEHTSELQSRGHLVCRLLLEKKKIYLSSH